MHVKDANGCTRDSIITIGQPTPVSMTLSIAAVRCYGGASGTVTVTGTGGITPYFFAIDAGAYSTSNLFTLLAAGAHTVHVKDANGCIKDSIINITQPSQLSLTYSVTTPLCNGDANASITFTGTGGTTPYLYSLNSSTFGTTNVFNGLSAGNYIMHVKDGNTCTRDSFITITQPAALAYTLAVVNVACNGDSSGSVTVSGSGGTPGYTYSIDSRAYGTSNVLSTLLAGAHTVHMKDANSCIKDSAINITEPTKLKLTYSTVSPLCNADTNGSITIVASGGTTPYQYALNTGTFRSSGAFINLGGGTYTLHVKDGNGCTRDSVITLTPPPALAMTLAVTNVSCNGRNDGSITINASGGVTPYQYAANLGSFGSSTALNGFGAGVQAIHLKDANGCIKDTNVTIIQPAVLRLGFTATNVLCNGGTSGTITIAGTGGTTPYSFALNTGAFGSSSAFSGLTAGTYLLHLKDANGLYGRQHYDAYRAYATHCYSRRAPVRAVRRW